VADLIYPVGLPGPVSWRQKTVDRRQMRDMRNPANANRIRWRDLGINASAEWVYSPAQMAIWKEWYEGPLAAQVARLRYFNAVLPGRGGSTGRVARYVTPPRRVHVGPGCWRVSAELYIRGVGNTVQQDATVAGDTGGFELREDSTFELREDSTFELRG
jgi:hypothetical protein